LGALTAGEHVGFTIAVAVTVWLVIYALTGFPDWMATALQVTAAAVTLVMVFVIQHTQQRVEAATQLKLDELVRDSGADDDVAGIEAATGDELERQRARRSTAPR
jgi:low affinity Fe/Cu permease